MVCNALNEMFSPQICGHNAVSMERAEDEAPLAALVLLNHPKEMNWKRKMFPPHWQPQQAGLKDDKDSILRPGISEEELSI